jgi:hypothetical protein
MRPALTGPVHHCQEISQLAAPIVEGAFTFPDTPEIEPDGYRALLQESSCQLMNDLVG